MEGRRNHIGTGREHPFHLGQGVVGSEVGVNRVDDGVDIVVLYERWVGGGFNSQRSGAGQFAGVNPGFGWIANDDANEFKTAVRGDGPDCWPTHVAGTPHHHPFSHRRD